MIRIPISKPLLGEEERTNLCEAIDSTWISSKGAFIEEFSSEFSKFCGTRYASTVCNGTVALHLALLAVGIKPGDEVIVPDLTFAATANAVLYCGAKPILADVDPETGCIRAEDIKSHISKKTKAVIPVHLYGHPCKMDEILELAESKDLSIIEDAAESHGAEFLNKKVGSLGHIGCFSFYGNKIITTGEGGMCTTNNSELFDRIELLKNHGMSVKKRYWHDVIGYNYRMTNLQAAIGVAQMSKVEFVLSEKIRIAKKYSELLSGLELSLPVQKPWARNVYWLYNIILSPKHRSSAKLINWLSDNGVEVRPIFFPLHIMPPYKSNSVFPSSDFISKNGLSLPSYPGLSNDDISYVCECIRQFIGRNK